MTAMHWLIGPQLLGLIFLLAGYIQKWYPPKKINGLYGYRMASSMKNQQTWDEANRYATLQMIKYAWYLVGIGLVVTALLELIHIKEDSIMQIKVGLMLASSFITVIMLITSTETHLQKYFDDKPL